MPINEEIWNPYRLIPIREELRRETPVTDEKFTGFSGSLSCSIENLTSLFVGGNRLYRQQFYSRDGRCVIPGSSLKGMFRSLSEIIGGGCNVTDSRGQYSKRYAACNRVNALCISCRMFGMMERGSGAKVHKGKISIGDALIREEQIQTKAFEVLLSSCGTRHEPFYRTPGTGKIDGLSRKLYFHQPNRKDSVPVVPQNLKKRARSVNALLPGHHFDFSVDFSNLTEDELSLLVYVISLQENVNVEIGEEALKLNGPMRHKIGNGKPLGLGSCHIKIDKMIIYPSPADRFSSLQQTESTVLTGEDLKEWIQAMTLSITNDTCDTMQQLRKMMVWNESDPRIFGYPDYYWFKDAKNSGKELRAI